MTDPHNPALNRAGRRLEAKRARRLTALGSGMVLATSAAGLAMSVAPAGADTIIVTSLDDSGANTLRQALADANNGDVIDLTGLTGTITLTTGSLQIEEGVTITGPGPGALTISGNDAGRIFTMYRSLDDGENVTISGLTLTDGDASSESDAAGGAIYFACEDDDVDAHNDLTLVDVAVTGNTAPKLGGGIYFDDCSGGDDEASYGNLTITDSRIADNSSSTSGAGGVWVDEGGTVTVERSTLAGNQAEDGGAMSIYMPNVVILSSTFSGNTATDGPGGALYLYSEGSILIANSTFTGNSAGGDGGAINMYGLAETASIIQTTISGNTAAGVGDGIYLGGYDEVPADASAATRGNDDEARAAGRGNSFGTTLLSGTIVSGNADGTDDIGTRNDFAVVTTDHSVIGGTSTGIVIDDQGGTRLDVTDPGLAPLADNGGPTQTMALLPGSVALDAGPDPVADFPGNADDQRGPGYPRVVNGRVDVGAFEVQPVVIEPTFTG